MKTSRRGRKASKFSHLRWSSYAIAAGATAVAGTPTAEAEIHYSGPINFAFKRIEFQRHSFPLSQGIALIGLREARGGNGDSSATFVIKGAAVSNGFRAYSSGSSALNALPRGSVISQGHFRFRFGTRTTGRLQDYTCYFSGWQEPGTYYIGFRFNNGLGRQYGWVRIKWGGCLDSAEPHNKYIVEDYAWGDPGDKLKTGQTQLREDETQVAPPSAKSAEAAPLTSSQGSLGLLALGAVGLQAWRRSRRVD
jgi:hypothetical protein